MSAELAPRVEVGTRPDVVDATPAASGAGRVIAVLSPKGGLGKTTLAANLAVGLARIAPDSVVLVDADLQFGDIANVLDLEPTHTLPELVSGAAADDDLVLKTLLAPHPEGFFTVCGAASPIDAEHVSADGLGALLERLARTFAWVVVDTTPGLGEHTLAVLDRATDSVAVTSLAVPNLRAMRTELAVLDRIGIVPSNRHLVLNQAVTAGGLVVADAGRILETVPDVVIPHSRAVPVSTNRGIPVLLDAPRDPATKAITTLLARITGLDRARFTARRTKA